MSGGTLRVLWPILDDTVPARQIADEALADLPQVARRARARITGPPRWHVARSTSVPGSGRITTHVLILEAPAEPLPPRPYHRQGATP